MKTTKKSAVAALTATALIMGLGFWYNFKSQQARVPVQSINQTPASVSSKTNGNVKASLPLASVAKDQGFPSPVVTEKFRESTLQVYKHRRSVDRNTLMEDQYARLAKDPEAIRVASLIVGSPQMSTQIFADDQAYARVFAIGLLDYLARNGQTASLEESVQRIGRYLSENGSRAQGVDADFVDLLSSYIRNTGIQSIVDHPEEFLQRISYSQTLALDVEKAFYDSGVLRKMTPEQNKILRPYFTAKQGQVIPKQETH